MAGRTRLVAGVFAVAVTLALSLASGADAFVYWSTRYDAIGRANLDGSGVNPSFINPVAVGTGGPYTPTGVAVDGKHVYWSANLVNSTGHEDWVLGRASLDGSSVASTFITGARFPTGVAVDGEHIYWADQNGGGSSAIGRASLDGSGVNQSFISGLNGPCGVAVDSAHVYWTTGNAIDRANLDGTGVNESFITLNPLNGPADTCGVAVDSKHIYWADTSHGVIGRANLDSTGVDESFVSGANGPCGVAVDSAHIYWATDGGSGLIGRANLDGSGVDQGFISVTGAFMCGVAVDALLPTTTTIMSPENSILYGQDATFTATVLNTPSSSPTTPTGTVQFKVNGIDDGSPVALAAGGQADYTPTFLLDVGDIVTAEYTGNAQLGASTSPGSQLSVQSALTGTTLTASSNPANPDDELTFIATVTNTSTSIVPFGSVEFSIDSESVLEPLPLNENGQAGIDVSELRAGDHTVRALYYASMTGIPDFTGSQASLTEHITSPQASPPASAASPPHITVTPISPNTAFRTVRASAETNGTLDLTELAPGPGTFTAVATMTWSRLRVTVNRTAKCRKGSGRCHKATRPAIYGTASATASAPGEVRLVIKPTVAARKTLNAGRALHVTVTITFRSAHGGSPATQTSSLTVRRHKAKRR
jgi:hypothetical protein